MPKPSKDNYIDGILCVLWLISIFAIGYKFRNEPEYRTQIVPVKVAPK